MNAAPPPAVRLEGRPLRVTLRAMERAVATGALSVAAAEWTARAAREAGEDRNPMTVARLLADRMRATVAFAADEYGVETIQSPEETLVSRRAGDCDDFATAYAALARRGGLRTGLAVLYVRERGEDVPVHVLPVLEDPETFAVVPVELTSRTPTPFGVWPKLAREGEWSITWTQARDNATQLAGLLDGLIGGVFSFFGAKEQAKGAKSVAKTNLKATETTAAAARDVATIQAQQAQGVATTQARSFSEAVAFARAALPVVYRLGLVAGAVQLFAVVAESRRPRRASRAA